MFADSPDSTLYWKDLELTATLAGGCARKCQTLILSRGKVEAIVGTRPGKHAVDDSKMMWEPDLLTRYPNTQGPLKGRRRASMICVPVMDVRGAVAGVVQVARTLDFHELKGNKGYPKPFRYACQKSPKRGLNPKRDLLTLGSSARGPRPLSTSSRRLFPGSWL